MRDYAAAAARLARYDLNRLREQSPAERELRDIARVLQAECLVMRKALETRKEAAK